MKYLLGTIWSKENIWITGISLTLSTTKRGTDLDTLVVPFSKTFPPITYITMSCTEITIMIKKLEIEPLTQQTSVWLVRLNPEVTGYAFKQWSSAIFHAHNLWLQSFYSTNISVWSAMWLSVCPWTALERDNFFVGAAEKPSLAVSFFWTQAWCQLNRTGSFWGAGSKNYVV